MTPAPWTVTPPLSGRSYITGPNGVFLAEVVREHDARVMALAPEMAEALRELLEHEGERELSGIGTEHDSDALESAKGRARSILARLPESAS